MSIDTDYDNDTEVADESTEATEVGTVSVLKHYLDNEEGKQVIKFQEGSTVIGYASQNGKPRLYTVGAADRANLDNTVEYPVWIVKTGKAVALPENAKYLGTLRKEDVIYTVFGG